jgi:hypothetical protein
MTPLLMAASRGVERKGTACLELLLAKGANLDATDDSKKRRTFIASKPESTERSEFLRSE